MKKSTRILLTIVLGLVLIAISVPEWFSFSSYNYDDAARYTAGGCEIHQPVKTIDVSWVDGRVNIATHGGNEIILSEMASGRLKTEEKVHWLLDGDTLYVKYVRAGRNYSSRLDKELTLLLPESMALDAVLISGVSAQVQAELPSAETVSIESVSGAADVLARQTEEACINTVSGNVLIRFAAAPERIDVDAVSAEVTVQLPESAGFTAEMGSVSGKIDGQLLEGSTGGKTWTRGNGECSIRMNSVSGGLRLDAYTR